MARPTAAITIDVEPDYNGTARDALERLPDLLSVTAQLGVPLTAFVEGRLFEDRPDLIRRLVDAGADVQLHCYDHRRPGDDAADLERGVRAYARCLGRNPRGYRAHTFRLSEGLFQALRSHGFRWDSSILPGFGLGANRSAGWRTGDWFRFQDGPVIFPVARFRGTGVPFTQSYRLLMPRMVERGLLRLAPLPRLVIHDMHMVDLVRSTGSLAQSPLPGPLKGLYRASWRGGRTDSFDLLASAVAELRRRDHRFVRLDDLYQEVAATP